MRPLKEMQYTKLAEAVATDFVSGDVPLNDSVEKLAIEFDMNQEQIKRLCEATNNTTFNKLFNAKDKTAEDRIIEFDIADSQKVLKKLGGRFSNTPKEAALNISELYELPDEMYAVRHPEAQTKTASAHSDFEWRRMDNPLRAEKDTRAVAKTLDYLRSEKLAADMEYEDYRETLVRNFKRLYVEEPFEAFEKKAASLHGAVAVDALNELRSRLRMPAADYDLDCLQKCAGLVDDTTAEMLKFAEWMECAKKRANMKSAIALLEKANVR